MKEKKDIIFKIIIIVIVLTIALILKHEIFDGKEKKVYKLSQEKCEIKNNEYTKNQKVKYDDTNHNIKLNMIKKEDNTLETKVYIDEQLISTIDTGKTTEKITCNTLKSNLYIVDSKYLAILLGKHEEKTITYYLYFYNENKLTNPEGEKLFTYKKITEDQEKLEGHDKTLELENIEFDGKSFKHLTNCNIGKCKKETIKFDGIKVQKQIEQNEEELTAPY